MAVQRRKVRDEQDAWSLLDELDASGLEIRDFCERRAIDGRSLNCWRLKLGTRTPDPTRLRLVEVSNPQPARKAEYRVVVGEVVVHVDDDFRDDTLARILRLAAAC